MKPSISRISALSLLVAIASLTSFGCKSTKASDPAALTGTSVVGSYVGKGEFSSGGRSLPLEATVHIREDGTYELMTTLSLFGKEQGNWTIQDRTLTLTYVEVPADPIDRSAQLGNAMKRSIPPRNWTVSEDFSQLSLNDGPMTITVMRQR